MTIRTSPLLFLALATALVICWSSGFVGIRFATDSATVPQILFGRSLLSGLCLLPLALLRGPRITPRAVIEQGAYAFLGMFLYLGGFALAIGEGVPTGLVALMGGNTIQASMAKLPGMLLALATAIAYALGTVFLKRWPIAMPSVSSAAWQLGIGCLPVAILGLILERPDIAALSALGWSLIAYNIVVQQCVGFVCWLLALQRLPASVAATGTMLVPVIGVIASAVVLGEPLGAAQIAALIYTTASVALAVRS